MDLFLSRALFGWIIDAKSKSSSLALLTRLSFSLGAIASLPLGDDSSDIVAALPMAKKPFLLAEPGKCCPKISSLASSVLPFENYLRLDLAELLSEPELLKEKLARPRLCRFTPKWLSLLSVSTESMIH